MTVLLEHPPEFKMGIRVLMRAARNKDNAVPRKTTMRVSYSINEFDDVVQNLLDDLRDGERIYGCVDARNFLNAQRAFEHEKTDADFSASSEYTLSFYKNLAPRWTGALMSKAARKTRLLMFDVDSPDELVLQQRIAQIEKCFSNPATSPSPINAVIHTYKTKNGFHILTNPFNYSALPSPIQEELHTNAMMLWAYNG